MHNSFQLTFVSPHPKLSFTRLTLQTLTNKAHLALTNTAHRNTFHTHTTESHSSPHTLAAHSTAHSSLTHTAHGKLTQLTSHSHTHSQTRLTSNFSACIHPLIVCRRSHQMSRREGHLQQRTLVWSAFKCA